MSIFGVIFVLGTITIANSTFAQNITDDMDVKTPFSDNNLVVNSTITNITDIGKTLSGDSEGYSILPIPTDPPRKTIIDSNTSAEINSLTGSQNLSISPANTCTTLDGTSSNDIGLNQQTPCTVSLSNAVKDMEIDIDYEKIQNDDSDDIKVFSRQNQQPDTFVLNPGEFLVFSRNGGEDYDNLNIFLVDGNVGDGQLLGLDQNSFARIVLDHFAFANTDIFMIPNIEDSNSVWKLVANYENNEELESYFIADSVIID